MISFTNVINTNVQCISNGSSFIKSFKIDEVIEYDKLQLIRFYNCVFNEELICTHKQMLITNSLFIKEPKSDNNIIFRDCTFNKLTNVHNLEGGEIINFEVNNQNIKNMMEIQKLPKLQIA